MKLIMFLIILTSSLSFGLTADEAKKQSDKALVKVLKQDYKQCKAELEEDINLNIKQGFYHAVARHCAKRQTIVTLQIEYIHLGFVVHISDETDYPAISVEWFK